jgi:hypothetical protein
MDKAKIALLLELIGDMVSAEGPWVAKRNAVLAECSDDTTNLDEFISWFEPETK